MLGTNDLKMRFHVTPYDIATGIETLIWDIKKSGCGRNGGQPEILVVCPAEIYHIGIVKQVICREGIEKAEQLAEYYALIAKRNNTHFMKASDFAEPSSEDGMHFTPEGHRALANGIYRKIVEIMGWPD